MKVCPLIFEPIYKPKIWGGDRIFTYFDRPPVSGGAIGESWELADLEEDQSRVVAGEFRGKTLNEILAKMGRDLIGDAELFEGRFPLLIKFLDARESLSVQVHPTEDVARKLGGNVRVKNEAWYILDTDPAGAIYHGLESGVTAESFREAMLTGRVEGILRKIPVKQGDCYYLPSGTAHALGAGVLVAEIQTPSDITYRTYDWSRVDSSTGRPRELHLDRAMECIDFKSPSPPARQDPISIADKEQTATRLVTCDSFLIDKVDVAAGSEFDIHTAELTVWMILAGGGLIDWDGKADSLEFCKGNVILLPAALPGIKMKVTSDIELLAVTLPSRGKKVSG